MQDAIRHDANARIAEARNQAAQAFDNAAKANEQAAQLEVTAAELHQRNLELSQALEAERIKRLNLEKSLEPRHISPKSATAIIEALTPFAGQKIQVNWFSTSPESINFADRIQAILLASGWMVFSTSTQRGNHSYQRVLLDPQSTIS